MGDGDGNGLIMLKCDESMRVKLGEIVQQGNPTNVLQPPLISLLYVIKQIKINGIISKFQEVAHV